MSEKVHTQEPFKVALIGCGRIAPVHIEAVKRVTGLVLSAVCDIREDRMKRFSEAHGVRGFLDYQEMLKEAPADLVAIATPNGMHFPIAHDCFKAGFHVLLEKPITIANRDAESLIQAAQKHKRHFFAVKQVRYNPSIQVTRDAIREGKLGKIYNASLVVRWTRPQEYYEQDGWRGTLRMDGGSLLNQGIHYVDVMQWLVGDAQSVFGCMDTFCHTIEIEDLALGLVKFKNGAAGTIEFTVNTYPHNLECSLTLLGETGSIKLSGSAMNEIETWEVRNVPRPAIPSGFAPYVYEGGLYQGSCPNHIFVYQDILNVFQGKAASAVNGAEALRSLRLVNGLYESARTRKVVDLPC